MNRGINVDNIISVEALRKKLQNIVVLKDIALEVKKGEIMAIVGPSGSGKSTLLKCLNRLTDLDHGTIRFEGKNITDWPPIELRRNLVLLPQESIMLQGSVFDNVAYGPSLMGEIDENHIQKCIKQVGLSEQFVDRNADKLSGGEKKRVALARALALKPKMLLLDEPTSGVDPKNVKKIEDTITGFSRNLKLTVLWVTHYVEQAKRVSDRIANLKNGQIKEVRDAIDFRWDQAY